MNELDLDRLYRAWSDATVRLMPPLDAGVRRRVLSAYAGPAQRKAVPVAYRWALGGVAVALVAGVVMLRTPSATSFQVAGHAGQIGEWMEAPATREVAVQFSEGTLVSLGKGSRGRVTRVTHGGARVELGNGSVDAEVTHLPGADWRFGAGPFEVAVTGTHLNVVWAPSTGRFELSVSRGSVIVQGPFILAPQAVRAGQVCRVDLNRHSMELSAITSEPARVAAEATPAAAPPTAVAAVVPPAAISATPVSDADVSPGPAAPPGTSSNNVRAVSPESLLDQARAARLAGRTDQERALLLACRKRAKGQAAAAQAAYLLGRASAGGQAADWFETYLREEPQGLLAREAAGRLIESYRAAGNVAAAESAASRYLARYPNGPHAALARHVLAARSESQD